VVKMDILLKPLKKDALIFQKIKSKNEIQENYDGYLIDSDEKEIRKIIEALKNKKKKIAVLGKDDNFNRRIIETCRINYFVSPEKNNQRDTLKQRDSGLNHVVAKEAREKDISIVIGLADVLKASGKNRSLLLARIMQNIKICRKVGCKIRIATFAENKEDLRSEGELKAFLFSLGMSSQQVRDAFEF
jgi:ribonuclease P/MRP protein subunit RPP1